MKKYKNKLFFCWLINVVIPIALGAAIYILVRPDTYISHFAYRTLGVSWQGGIGRRMLPRWIWLFLTGHASDILWAYGLTHAVFLILGKDRKCFLLTAAICVVFEVGMECMQLLPGILATFDWWDIALEICATAIASLIIKLQWEEKK